MNHLEVDDSWTWYSLANTLPNIYDILLIAWMRGTTMPCCALPPDYIERETRMIVAGLGHINTPQERERQLRTLCSSNHLVVTTEYDGAVVLSLSLE